MLIKIPQKENNRTHKPGKWRPLFGGIICLALSITGFWVAFYGEDIQGGIPFIAEAANQMIGRIMIGGGAVITGLLAVVAFREFFGKSTS